MGLLWGLFILGWGDVLKPNAGLPEPIGFYSGGCLSGADSLPLDGIGYQAMRPSRNRHYGHSSTLRFIRNLAQTLNGFDSGILIGDISQPRGGPMPSGHASHQVGLDVDIWFWTHPDQRIRSLTSEEREALPMISMLNSKGEVDSHKFSEEQILKLKLAALSPDVQRIFVNPAIKKYLCSRIPNSESDWLHALRPWSGHDAHFHVRLKCPADAPECIAQDPAPAGNGCDEIALRDLEDDSETEEETGIQSLLTELPKRCESVLLDPSIKNSQTEIPGNGWEDGAWERVQTLKNNWHSTFNP